MQTAARLLQPRADHHKRLWRLAERLMAPLKRSAGSIASNSRTIFQPSAGLKSTKPR